MILGMQIELVKGNLYSSVHGNPCGEGLAEAHPLCLFLSETAIRLAF